MSPQNHPKGPLVASEVGMVLLRFLAEGPVNLLLRGIGADAQYESADPVRNGGSCNPTRARRQSVFEKDALQVQRQSPANHRAVSFFLPSPSCAAGRHLVPPGEGQIRVLSQRERVSGGRLRAGANHRRGE